MDFKLLESTKMSLNPNKVFFFTLILISNFVFTSEKEIKRILSDYSEFDRKTNIAYFYKNVRVELGNGYLLCDKAIYNRSEGWLVCESNIYCVIISTNDSSRLEIRSFSLKYNTLEKKVNFYSNVESLYNNYQQTIDFDVIKLKCDELQFDILQEVLSASGNVLVETENNKIVCSKALYKFKEGILLLNENIAEKEQISIISLTEKYKFKSCRSNTAKINFTNEEVFLKGNVEIIF